MSESPERISISTESPSESILDALSQLIPGAVQDGVLDARMLSELTGLELAGLKDGPERFGLMWAGKSKAVEALQAPSMAALVPDTENSINWDTAENVFIEGDNLEVLKLLQKAYNDQVKLIYIDPPYNTGNDFVYNDDFSEPLKHYLEVTGQVDSDGNRLVANTEVSGRKHSNWLSMMYPRLVLARNILREDGFIFISINDVEQPRLRQLCDEIFGEENFVACMIWMKGKEGGNDNSGFGMHHEYIICYARDVKVANETIGLDAKDTSRHISALSEPNLVRSGGEIYRDGELFQLINLSKQKDYVVTIPLLSGEVLEWPSYCPQRTIDEYIRIGKLFVGKNKVPYVKSFLVDEKSGTKPSTLLESKYGTTKAGGIALREIFGESKIFSYPKPPSLIQRILEIACRADEEESLVVDFFAGSGSTGHAVWLQNALDAGNRKFVLVNISELVAEDSPAFKAGFRNVAEITRARLKAVSTKMSEQNLVGLRCLSLNESAFMRNVGKGEAYLFSETLSLDASDDAVASEALLKLGVRLDKPWIRTQIDSQPVTISDGVAVVLARELTDDICNQALELDAVHTVVFLEDAFAGKDAIKANAHFAFKQANRTMKTI